MAWKHESPVPKRDGASGGRQQEKEAYPPTLFTTIRFFPM
jgi:hypothetical protein